MQSILEDVYNKLIEQGKPAYNNELNIGLLRLKENDSELKCAIGHLLSDEQIKKYNINLDDSAFTFQDELIKELAPNNEDYCFAVFLHQLQVAHDKIGNLLAYNLIKDFEFKNELKKQFNLIAKMFDLKEIE